MKDGHYQGHYLSMCGSALCFEAVHHRIAIRLVFCWIVEETLPPWVSGITFTLYEIDTKLISMPLRAEP